MVPASTPRQVPNGGWSRDFFIIVFLFLKQFRFVSVCLEGVHQGASTSTFETKPPRKHVYLKQFPGGSS